MHRIGQCLCLNPDHFRIGVFALKINPCLVTGQRQKPIDQCDMQGRRQVSNSIFWAGRLALTPRPRIGLASHTQLEQFGTDSGHSGNGKPLQLPGFPTSMPGPENMP